MFSLGGTFLFRKDLCEELRIRPNTTFRIEDVTVVTTI